MRCKSCQTMLGEADTVCPGCHNPVPPKATHLEYWLGWIFFFGILIPIFYYTTTSILRDGSWGNRMVMIIFKGIAVGIIAPICGIIGCLIGRGLSSVSPDRWAD